MAQWRSVIVFAQIEYVADVSHIVQLAHDADHCPREALQMVLVAELFTELLPFR